MDTQPSFFDIFSDQEFHNYLSVKSQDYYEFTKEKYQKKTLTRFDQEFISNLFTKSGKTTEAIVVIFSRDGGLIEKDRLNILSALISEIIFGSKTDQIWIIARFFSFIFSVKPYGFNFLAECFPNLTELFPVEFDDLFKKKNNIFENIISCSLESQPIPPMMNKFMSILKCCTLIFPYTYNNIEQSSIKFHSLIGERLSFNCVQIFGMAINQTIIFAKEFSVKKQGDINIDILQKEIVKMKSEMESLRKKVEIAKQDGLAMKSYMDQTKEKQCTLLESFEKYKKDIIDFTIEKNSELEKLQRENQKLREDSDKTMFFMNSISFLIKSDEESRRELCKSLERSNFF